MTNTSGCGLCLCIVYPGVCWCVEGEVQDEQHIMLWTVFVYSVPRCVCCCVEGELQVRVPCTTTRWCECRGWR